MEGPEKDEQDSTDASKPTAVSAAEAAAHPEAAAPRPHSRLTFHPARDDPVQLRSYLNFVSTRYALQANLEATRNSQLDPTLWARNVSQPQYIQQASGHVYNIPPQAMARTQGLATGAQPGSRKRPATQLLLANPAASLELARTRPPSTYAAAPAAASAATVPGAGSFGPSDDDMPPPSRRRRRSTNHASLIRAKNIDVYKRDPEEDSPPNETEDERRRRRERINGRRKRAKKMIEIDFLNERYHTLRDENIRLKSENDSFRERISMLRRFSKLSIPLASSSQGVSQGEAVDVERSQRDLLDEKTVGAAQKGSTSEQKVEIESLQQQQSPSPLQFALAPSTFPTRRAFSDNTSPSEETKDSFVQPQFVGQERIGGNPLLTGNSLLAATLQELPGRTQLAGLLGSNQNTAAIGNQIGDAAALPSSSIMSALFNHRHQETPPLAHLPGDYSLFPQPNTQRLVQQSLLQGSVSQNSQLLHRSQQLQHLQQQLQQNQTKKEEKEESHESNHSS